MYGIDKSKNVLIFRILIIYIALNFPSPVLGIIGGREAEEGTFKYAVSLQTKDKDGTWNHYCGGTALSNRWVVSAAHCIVDFFENIKRPQSRLRIQAGTLMNRPQCKNQYKVKKFRIANNYVRGSSLYDVALIKLAKEINEVHLGHIQYITNYNFHLHKGDVVTMAGFGRTTATEEDTAYPRKLQVIESLITSSSKLKRRGNVPLTGIIDPIGKGTCYGDSGGPVIIKKDYIEFLYGIIKGMVGTECSTGEPNFFTNISYYASWIEDVMTEKSSCTIC